MGMYTKYIIITLTLYNGNKCTRHDWPRTSRPGGPVPLSAVGYQSSSYDVWLINTISGTFSLECHVTHTAKPVRYQLA